MDAVRCPLRRASQLAFTIWAGRAKKFLTRRQNVMRLPSKSQEGSGILAAMNTQPRSFSGEDRFETKIEALLSFEPTSSIVDSLLALPDEEELKSEAGSFGRVVHDRLQARLAQKMRAAIEGDEDGKSAA